MKSIFFYVLLSLLFSLSASAQIGIKAGLTLGGTYGSAEEYDGEKVESIDPALGYQFGLTAALLDLKAFRLNAELLYENRRSVKNADFEIIFNEANAYRASIEYRDEFQYVTLPLLASFGGDKLNVYFGPGFSYLLSAKSEVEWESTTYSPQAPGQTSVTVSEEKQDLINGDDYDEPFINRFSVALNAGLVLPLLPSTTLDIRIYHTITDVTNDAEDRSIVDRVVFDPQEVRLRDDYDSTVGLQANLVYHF